MGRIFADFICVVWWVAIWDMIEIWLLDNQEIIKETIDKYNIQYSISYGKNYFPNKEYNGVIYEEGEYESLVISLGESQGDNWWCVLFPPLCLIDEEQDEVEYTTFIKELIDKYF